MPDRFRTVKSRVIILMILFALFVTILVSAFSFYLMYMFQLRTAVQSAEFNLQLVASVIEQDLRDLTALGKWCGVSSYISDYFLSDNNVKPKAIRAYNRMNEEFMNNRARSYVRRLIVVDDRLEKILQVGNFAGSSEPVTIYSIGKLEGIELGPISEWEAMISDPFYLSSEPFVLPLLCPVYHSGDRSTIGTVFLAASTSVITDKLIGYSLSDDESLYLTLGSRSYQIDGRNFTFVEPSAQFISYNIADPTSEKTVAGIVRDQNGEERTVVSYPIRDGIILTQVLSNQSFFPRQGGWIWMFIALCFMILFLSLFITYSMDKNISRPVRALRKKIDAIAKGDFSFTPDIESGNELGQVGRGINLLSRDVVALMERRVADEKNKRELEYRMLQSQINPHFLYNTLNSIKMMATIQKADGIAEMTTSLSRLLKTVAKDIRKVVPLRDELALLDDYIVIQKYRYGDSITLLKEVAGDSLLDAPIPRFTLQPIVENAIFHGLEPKGGGTIRLVVRASQSHVLCSVTDDGIGMSRTALKKILEDSTTSSGMLGRLGVRNVDERLRYAFGADYGLMIRSKAGSYTTMTIRLPFFDTGMEEQQ